MAAVWVSVPLMPWVFVPFLEKHFNAQ